VSVVSQVGTAAGDGNSTEPRVSGSGNEVLHRTAANNLGATAGAAVILVLTRLR
jgi:hypothetical protein